MPFIRTADNYQYNLLPKIKNSENDKRISRLMDIDNFLYLINVDNFDTKKIIDGAGQTNYDMVLIDLYYNSFPYANAELELLKMKKMEESD